MPSISAPGRGQFDRANGKAVANLDFEAVHCTASEIGIATVRSACLGAVCQAQGAVERPFVIDCFQLDRSRAAVLTRASCCHGLEPRSA